MSVVDVPDGLRVTVLPSLVPSPSLIPQRRELTITVIVAGRLLKYLTATEIMPLSAKPNKLLADPASGRSTSKRGQWMARRAM